MAVVHVYLDVRAKRKDGTYPLKLVLTHHSRAAMVPLEVFLRPQEWDARRRLVMLRADRAQLNGYIERRKVLVEDTLRRLTLEGRCINKTAQQLRDLVLLELEPGEQSKPVGSFVAAYDAFAAQHDNTRTRDIYAYTRERMGLYARDLEDLALEDITRSWLVGFDRWLMRTSPSANARSIHMRNIRAAFNYALDEELTTWYPFRKFRIRREATAKRALPVDTLRAIFDAPVRASQQKYVDCFKLMFCLVGINAVDLLLAPAAALQDGRLVFRRAKTHRIYSIKVEPEALALLEQYRGRRGRLVCFAEGCQDYRNFLGRMNKNLHELRPGLTTYYCRHSWATIAAVTLDIPKETVAAALGHGAVTVTDIYIDFDRAKVDDANRRVLDYVFGQEQKKAEG